MKIDTGSLIFDTQTAVKNFAAAGLRWSRGSALHIQDNIMNFSKNYSNRSRTLQARIVRRIIYLLIFLCVLVGILVFAPQVLANEADNAQTTNVHLIGANANLPSLAYQLLNNK